MRILGNKDSLILLIFALGLCGISHAQSSVKTSEKEGVINVEQDERLNELVAYKTKLNKTDNEKRFRIQIYNGTLEGAQKAKRVFNSEFKDLVCDIAFETPNYKVRVGKFRTRLEADRYLLKVKEEYPSAFLLQP
ncbi:SPOR domain-containing protein [Galbibacter pacificus]|uniref:SPOR domain-containing protein n=1 Tax=Galbibacter pacificus TaxID=2996052 RepID=A0ABT6FTF6_9FLAO|nr:SPOR domain-containing protein [Galbibacter pacificus]MDG3583076.1 SPOR domain-containing protein [Galbibacter pacificus]MDG3586557.1 SPOR domain-containing protein [Galbibacter pacificus]